MAPGSPAEAAGWRKGERITALEGAPIGDDWWRTWAGWFRAQDGTKVKLTTGDGTAREVLASYLPTPTAATGDGTAREVVLAAYY